MIHSTAEVEPGAGIGDGTRERHDYNARAWAKLGAGCVLSYGVFVHAGVGSRGLKRRGTANEEQGQFASFCRDYCCPNYGLPPLGEKQRP